VPHPQYPVGEIRDVAHHPPIGKTRAVFLFVALLATVLTACYGPRDGVRSACTF
jgi:hypothetical protein